MLLSLLSMITRNSHPQKFSHNRDLFSKICTLKISNIRYIISELHVTFIVTPLVDVHMQYVQSHQSILFSHKFPRMEFVMNFACPALTHTCTVAHTCTHTHVRTYTRAHTCANTHTHMYVVLCMYIHIHICNHSTNPLICAPHF